MDRGVCVCSYFFFSPLKSWFWKWSPDRSHPRIISKLLHSIHWERYIFSLIHYGGWGGDTVARVVVLKLLIGNTFLFCINMEGVLYSCIPQNKKPALCGAEWVANLRVAPWLEVHKARAVTHAEMAPLWAVFLPMTSLYWKLLTDGAGITWCKVRAELAAPSQWRLPVMKQSKSREN